MNLKNAEQVKIFFFFLFMLLRQIILECKVTEIISNFVHIFRKFLITPNLSNLRTFSRQTDVEVLSEDPRVCASYHNTTLNVYVFQYVPSYQPLCFFLGGGLLLSSRLILFNIYHCRKQRKKNSTYFFSLIPGLKVCFFYSIFLFRI